MCASARIARAAEKAGNLFERGYCSVVFLILVERESFGKLLGSGDVLVFFELLPTQERSQQFHNADNSGETPELYAG